MHGRTAQQQPECNPCAHPFHRGAVDFFELAGLLAYRPIRANWPGRAMWSDWGVSPFGDRASGHPASRTAMRIAPGGMRCVSRGSHGDSCVAAVGRPCEPGHLLQICFLHRYVGVELDMVAPTGI
jgi:hypothetical protein